MLDSIGHVGGVVNLGHQFQIMDALTDGDSELVGMGDSGKCFSGTLAPGSFAQKVFIAREENSAKDLAVRGPAGGRQRLPAQSAHPRRAAAVPP